jgi:hypothetical protein
MAYQNISATLTDAVINQIKDHAAQARALMPFLQTLSTDERKKFYKMGPKRLAWVQACLDAAKNHPEVLPTYFKVGEFEKDFELARVLADIRSVYESLFTDLDDTTMGVGKESTGAASQVMGWVDDAAKTEPGLKSVSDSLHEFFTQANAAAQAAAAAAAAKAASPATAPEK